MNIKLVSKQYIILFVGFLLFLSGMFCILGGNTTKTADADVDSTASYYCLRDEYYINADNQYAYGLCWEFATLKSIETCLAINTGEYYDFSEAYIALIQKSKNLSSSYYVGGNGGTISYAMNYIKEYGLLLESDFNFDELNYANNDNYDEYLAYLSQYADKNIASNLTYKSLTSLSAVKNHLLTNGSIYLGVRNYDYFKNSADNTYYLGKSSTVSDIGHAVSIIGWDDNYTATIDGITYTGAYIVLNSYGNDWGKDGVFYCLYDYYYSDIVFGLWGVEYSEPDINLELNSVNNYEVDIANAYNQQTNYTKSTAVTKTNNIFEYEGTSTTVNLEYELKNYLNYTDISVEIYKSGSLSNDFNILQRNGIYTITSKDGADILGTYKIVFKIDGNNVIKDFLVVSGLEFSYIYYYYKLNNSTYMYLYSNFSTTNNQTTINVYKNFSNSTYSIKLVYSAYSSIATYKVDNPSIAYVKVYNNYLELVLGDNGIEFATVNLTLTNSAGRSVVYTVNYYGTQEILANIQYNLTGVENNNPDYIYFDSTSKYYIESPTQNGQVLSRVYYYDESGAEVNCDYDNEKGQFYITKSNLLYSPTYNSLTASYNIPTFHYSLLLNFEFSEEVSMLLYVKGESGASSTRFDYGENLSVSVTLTNGTILSQVWSIDDTVITDINNISLEVGQYVLSCLVTYSYQSLTMTASQSTTITITPIELSVAIDNNVFVYNGTDQVPTVSISGFLNDDSELYSIIYPKSSVDAGLYYLEIKLNSNNYTLPTNFVYYRITPSTVVIYIDNKTSKIGEKTQELTYSISGNLYDDLNVQLSVNLGSVAGNYRITATCDNNPNYYIFVQNGIYTLEEATQTPTTTGESSSKTSAMAQTVVTVTIGLGVVAVVIAVIVLIVSSVRRHK